MQGTVSQPCPFLTPNACGPFTEQDRQEELQQSSTLKVVRYENSEQKQPGPSCPVLRLEKDTPSPKPRGQARSILRVPTAEKITRVEGQGLVEKEAQVQSSVGVPMYLTHLPRVPQGLGEGQTPPKAKLLTLGQSIRHHSGRGPEKPQESVEPLPRAFAPLEDLDYF